ncbi:GFA family protein, partial [Novilysobacter longmucuonensis]
MEGSCLCNSIIVSAPAEAEVGVCHCSMCRRWGGGPMLAVHCRSG